ncbi:unnamed protein product [Strongylus vulgaris]|uniref:Major facilitator superfamily (MFS) profile domain-containing protein n=1 Tax=Strongylus vulgaris TaxID=40348 RepID=A0A3P7ISY7_STRVU|nr:unnamed protein product [Strongylus vulgaris]
MMIGLMIGFLIMGRLLTSFGAKGTAITIRCSLGIVGSIAMVLCFVTGRFEFFVLGHFLSGVTAALKIALLIYISDCSPEDKRDSNSIAVNSGGVIAVLIVTPLCVPNLIGSDQYWVILPMTCSIMATAHLLIAGRFPKSPKDLYIKEHNKEEARAALRFFYNTHYDIGKF